ncbi:MAG: hypothetical protein GXP63_05985 [DPANN group archaeon]|nr:hypothetical protein [DPANN group archaeon]
MKRLLFAVFFLLLVLPLVVLPVKADRVIANSQDWRDVYSSMIYANLNGDTSSFLVSQRHAALILNTIPTSEKLLAISSVDRPYIVGYKSFLESRGYTADEVRVDNANLELARRLTDTKKFIIIDDSYGYNAVSVGPYASMTKSYVLFADRNTIDDVVSFLNDRNPTSVIIYGIVDPEVRDGLAPFNPDIINFDGDRFKNNLEIVKRYQKIAPKKQVILTNGEFLEEELLGGTQPVLFLGAQNVPKEIADYLKNSDFEVAVLIGNQYVGSATAIRRSTGLSVFVKFAQSARSPQGAINPVEGLDIFYLPIVTLSLQIFSVEYNQATGMLEVTLRNNVEQATYFKGTYTLLYGDTSKTVGDENTQFIQGNAFITLNYPVNILEENTTVDAFVIFGESKFSLERTIEGVYNLTTVKVFDESDLDIIDVYYDAPNSRFVIEIKNIGPVDLYANAVISQIRINDIQTNLGMLGDPLLIPVGETRKLFIKADLTDQDIADNKDLTVQVRYGQRSTALVKLKKKTFALRVKKMDIVFYSLIGIMVILLILILLTRKKRCKHCHHKNPRKRKTCEKCGERL